MARHLMNIVKKEVKEILRDPRLFIGMILVPLLMFPIMGHMMRGFMQVTMEATKSPVTIGVLNLDEGDLADIILSNYAFNNLLKNMNITLLPLSPNIYTANEVVNLLRENSTIYAVIVFPSNFSNCINNYTQANIQVYRYIHEIRFQEVASGGRLEALINIISEVIRQIVVSKSLPSVNPSFIVNPIKEYPITIYRDKEMPGIPFEVFSSLMFSQGFTIPIVTFILVILAMQFAAISVASEKEEKTLETLLTLPVNRSTIIFGKLTGAILISIVGLIGYMLGFQYYISSIFDSTFEFGGDAQPFNISEALYIYSIQTEGYILLGANILLSLFACLSIAVVLAAFTEDVRSAQSMTSILIIPMMIGYFAATFYIGAMPETIKLVLLSIPFISPMIAGIETIQGNLINVLIADIIIIIEMVALILFTEKFYSSEKVLIAKIRLGRRRSLE